MIKKKKSGCEFRKQRKEQERKTKEDAAKAAPMLRAFLGGSLPKKLKLSEPTTDTGESPSSAEITGLSSEVSAPPSPAKPTDQQNFNSTEQQNFASTDQQNFVSTAASSIGSESSVELQTDSGQSLPPHHQHGLFSDCSADDENGPKVDKSTQTDPICPETFLVPSSRAVTAAGPSTFIPSQGPTGHQNAASEDAATAVGCAVIPPENPHHHQEVIAANRDLVETLPDTSCVQNLNLDGKTLLSNFLRTLELVFQVTSDE